MAAIEVAVVLPLLLMLLANVFDIGSYAYTRMEVQTAAQMGAQAALRACDQSMLPATVNCPSLVAAVTTAIQSTTLREGVALRSGSPSEGYYCVNADNVLQHVGDPANRPASCSVTGMPAVSPADYLIVEVTYTYSPMFRTFSFGGLLPTPITTAVRMRLG